MIEGNSSLTAAFAAEQDPDFDLRDLALPSRGGIGRHDDAQAAPLDDPFGALDIVGARPGSMGDPLTTLLEDPPRDVAEGPGPVELVAPRDAPTAATRLVESAPQHSVRALLDGLHEEFVRVLRDPARLSSRSDWSEDAVSEGIAAPTWDELSRQGEAFPVLRDIVLRPAGIDRLIQDFDPLGRVMPLDGEASADVLQLFGPDLVHGVSAAIPSLTRREHHALSPDSPMPTSHAQTAREEGD